MAKFTVFFKNKPIHTELFEPGVIHIGRDKTNNLSVDSLAIAPAHAAVIIDEKGSRIKQLNDQFPLIVNGEKINETHLQNGDTITVGKHAITFNTTESVLQVQHTESQVDKDLNSLNQEINPNINLPDANLQVMDGKHIGRVIPLKKAMTRLGHSGSGIVAISKRKEGYFIAALETNESIRVNKKTLDERSIKLNNNDQVLVDKTTMQFFLDS